MIGGGSLTASVDAGMLIGAVLLEAIILYIGYGAAEQLLGEPVVNRIKNN
ncbi:DUF7512 family protein [Natrinema limicola]|uniref:Uncharacterized protein n=1 Tax=Natrinema limicola JCM 13563 TaxID=1230457 RepID=M0CBP8_9EURY|nr:hypothetical protein [Natrinema limicola]ELZ20716.1 hypothetical protein C476_10377 [Natrinema limicola JCM 13563]